MAGKSSQPIKSETLIPRSMEDVLHESMMPYAEYVILERALPRVEDGLKPVQRRILYTMQELGVTPDKPHRKSARIVGDTLGKYHPHGDTSVYDAMVRMAQPFNMSMPLVDGHGNFGSVDGDSAAAMRYTEARMTPLATELLRDIDKDTVSFSLNFDDSMKEPDVLPSRFPNLLVNGASGIAVGLATNIPPHNLGEVIDAVIAQIDNPNISLDELMKLMPGPDFPTSGYLLEAEGLKEAYQTGRGRIVLRAKVHIETEKNGKKLIVITELPYQVNKAAALEKILAVSQEKKLLFSGISDIRDESDRSGMRAVIEVRKDADEQKILNYLYKYSDLQQAFGINMVAIADGKPQQLGLKELIDYYIQHQKQVVTRRTEHDLENARSREHVLSGLMIAILNLDEVIRLIRASSTPKQAKEGLVSTFGLTEIQAQAILDLRLQRLTGLEMLEIQKEHAAIVKLIAELTSILNSTVKLHNVIKKEMREIRQKYAIPRRTVFMYESSDIEVDQNDLKVVEELQVLLMNNGTIRRLPKKSQIPEEPNVRPLFVLDAKTDQKIWIFTNLGTQFTLAVDEIPETRPKDRAATLAGLIQLQDGEKAVAAYVSDPDGELLFYTKDGFIKRTTAAEYAVRTKSTSAIKLKEKDEVITVERLEGAQTLLLVSKTGMSIRIALDSVPQMGRVSSGVRGIKLEDNDAVIFASQVYDEGELLAISDKGYAKRSLIFDYELQGRNGKGLKTFDFKKNGSNGMEIAAVFYVREPFDFDIVQKHGTITRFNTESILIEPRFSKGQPIVIALLDDYVVGTYKV